MTFPLFITLTKTDDKGTIVDHPIHEGYTVEGWIGALPIAGKPLNVLRIRRNGVERLGIMITSKVESVTALSDTEIVFATANSHYALTLHPNTVFDPDCFEQTLVDALITDFTS